MKIICSQLELDDIENSWCCDVDKLNEDVCDRDCKKCFEEYGVIIEISS